MRLFERAAIIPGSLRSWYTQTCLNEFLGFLLCSVPQKTRATRSLSLLMILLVYTVRTTYKSSTQTIIVTRLRYEAERNNYYKIKTSKRKNNQPSHLHGHIKVGGFPIFPFDEHLLGGINQEHQAVSPCNFVVSY